MNVGGGELRTKAQPSGRPIYHPKEMRVVVPVYPGMLDEPASFFVDYARQCWREALDAQVGRGMWRCGDDSVRVTRVELSEVGVDELSEAYTGTEVVHLYRAEAVAWVTDEVVDLHAEIARLRSELNQATAVVEAAEAWRDQFAEPDAVKWPRRSGLIAAVDAYRAYRAAPTGGVEG